MIEGNALKIDVTAPFPGGFPLTGASMNAIAVTTQELISCVQIPPFLGGMIVIVRRSRPHCHTPSMARNCILTQTRIGVSSSTNPATTSTIPVQ